MSPTRFSICSAAVFLLATTPDVAPGQEAPASLSDGERAIHLLNRATFGPRPQDVSSVEALGIDAWLDRQLHPERIDDPVSVAVDERFPYVNMEPSELFEAFPSPRELQAMRERLQDSTGLSEAERRQVRRELGEKGPGRVLGELTAAKLTRAAHSERQLQEVMTDFWFDHFNVFWGKAADRWLVADYERTAIRPNVFGSFEDMLVATASHPAMLFYLDNWRSMAPDTATMRRQFSEAQQRQTRMQRRGGVVRRGRGGSRQGVDRASFEERIARLPGLNENYARELLELHTLGVDGGYTQDDVIAVARAFTGWSLQPPEDGRPSQREQRRRPAMAASPDGDYGFVYRDPVHDKGEKTILGKTFKGGQGYEEGLEVLHMLATHPSTARHVATQLVSRFVADDPPQALVDELTRVFLDTGGDLRAVTRALFTSESFYDPAHVGGRIKSPVILVASALRATDAEVLNPRALIETLRSLDQAPYLAEAPTGYEEVSAGWASGGAMLNRMNFAVALASGQVPGVRPDGAALFQRAEAVGPRTLDGLAAVILPGVDTGVLLTAIREDLQARPPETDRAAGMRALGMILGSPEFQRH